MNLIDSQDKSLEALKSFNSTIVTCRLYPPDAPQVTTAVERGYKTLKQIVRQKGIVSFVYKDDTPLITGRAISQDIIDSFPNLVVFRQLRLLGLPQLVLSLEMDRFAFGQLISVFNASHQKIKDYGGGAEYITSLGLADYFPEQLGGSGAAPVNSKLKPKADNDVRGRVRPALVACLLGKDKRPAVFTELKKKMLLTDSAVTILASGVALVLQEIQQTNSITTSPLFPLMLERAEKLTDPKHQNAIIGGLALRIVNTLKDTTFCVLLCQDYSDGFGSKLYDEQINLASQDKFAIYNEILQDQGKRAQRIGGSDSQQVQIFKKGFLRLMNTRKGKAFLSAEKAKQIINDGEKARKKNRLEVGIKEILRGRTHPFQSDEIVAHLPGVVRQMLRNQEMDNVTALLLNFMNYCAEEEKIPEDALLHNCFITICEIIIHQELWTYIELVYGSLVDVFKGLVNPDNQAERTIALLQELMQKSWVKGDYERGDSILNLFYQTRSEKGEGARGINRLVGRIQDKNIVRADLPDLLQQCLLHPKDEVLSYRLIYQGPIVVRLLIDSLIKSKIGPDRIKMIDLLTYSPSFLTSAVLERLPEHMPWFGKRNLIKLLGETGSEEDAETVLSYLTHEDFRVQREAFLCIYKIGGKNRKSLLLKGLDNSSELIKLDIIIALRKFGDEEVAKKLHSILEESEHFSGEIKNKILFEIMETLGRCSCSSALKSVQKYLRLRGQRSGRSITDNVWLSADKAIEFLENDLKEVRKTHLQASQLRKNALRQVSKINRPVAAQRLITGSMQEKAVRDLLSKGEKEKAQKQLISLVERVARSGNFSQAEKLREWMVEIDSTAFKYIVQAAEIIDREKEVSIDATHLEIWNELYELLSTAEFSNLFHSLHHSTFGDEEILVRQGGIQPSLFFINSGTVKLFFQDQGNDVLVKTLSKGEILGAGAFFDASVWTISAASLGSSDVSILHLEELNKWSEDFPEIEVKLANFCRQFERIEEYIEKSDRDRRLHSRYKLEGRISTMLLDNRGRSTGVNPAGELYDISLGGIAYLLRISVKDNVRQILGRQVVLELPYGDSPGEVVSVKGDILALKLTYAVENDYSVHVRFTEPLKQEQLGTIIAAARRETQI